MRKRREREEKEKEKEKERGEGEDWREEEGPWCATPSVVVLFGDGTCFPNVFC